MKTIRQKLEEHRHRVAQLRRRVSEVGMDIEFTEVNLGTLYYAVDFSEVYGYLNISAIKEGGGVQLNDTTPEVGIRQHQLGLSHLFDTLADQVYLLTPYTIEMWSYVNQQTRKRASPPNLQLEAMKEISQSKAGKLLAALNNSHPLNEEDKQDLLELVKGDFGKLCAEVRELIDWYEKGKTLSNLLQKRKLSYQIGDLLNKHHLGAESLDVPSRDEELGVFKTFPKESQEKNRFAKMVDARSLLFLRNINRVLEKKNAKLVFVTRDNSMRAAAEKLSRSPWFGWDAIQEHIRTTETEFLDLILRGISSDKDRLQWVLQAQIKLARIDESVKNILKRIGSPQTSLIRSDEIDHAEKILKQTAELRDEHVNLYLSLSEDSTNWLANNPDEQYITANLTPAHREAYYLLKNLSKFVSTAEYREIADKDARNIWDEINDECSQMLLLHEIGKKDISNSLKVLVATFQGTDSSTVILRSKGSMTIPSLQFISEAFQERLKALEAGDQSDSQSLHQIRRAILSVLFAVTSKHPEPENFLFMAFVLGLLDQWEEAVSMAERSRYLAGERLSLSSEIKRSEVDYFLAISRKMLAMLKHPRSGEVEEYVKAYEFIRRALRESPQDPRFLKEQGTIALLYSEARRNYQAYPTDKTEADLMDLPDHLLNDDEIISLLRQALGLAGADNRLKAKILNSLAYAEIMAVPPSLERAKEYLNQIDREMETAQKDRKMAFDVENWPAVLDTKIMLNATAARIQGDLQGLEANIASLSLILKKPALSAAEKILVESHIKLIRSWQADIDSINSV